MERKEAIEIVRKLYNESLFLKKDKEAIVTLIPEIEESEDEKIKKSFIRLIKAFYDVNFPTPEGFTREGMISWLKKQGEQKIQRCGVSGFTDIVQAIRTVYNEESAYDLVEYLTDLVSKKEQKPAEEIEPTPIFRIGDVLKRKGKDYTFRVDRIQGGYYHCDRNHGAYFPIEQQDDWELVEQKTAWTPMDEQRVENLLAIIEGHGYPGEVAWLNSLKDRVQPKQEWSNWDKTIIESIEALCDEKIESVVFQDVKEHVNDIKDWLKSLKERYTWKPSDEQIKVMSYLAKYYAVGIDEPNRSIITSLYEDLKKKLMEE